MSRVMKHQKQKDQQSTDLQGGWEGSAGRRHTHTHRLRIQVVSYGLFLYLHYLNVLDILGIVTILNPISGTAWDEITLPLRE